MTDNDGGPAFPQPDIGGSGIVFEGMSLRDWFAGQALAGLMACNVRAADETITANACYQIADAMLKAREVKP